MKLSIPIKKVIYTVILIISYSNIQAQSFTSGFGVGAVMSTASYTDAAGVKKTTQMRPGFKAFWLGRVNIEGRINFAPEIGYAMKGFRVKNPEPTIAEQEIIMHYLEFKFIQEYTLKDKFFVKVGPSIGVALAGTDKQLSTTNIRTNQKLPFNFAAWGRFEGAINISIGTHFGGGWLAEIGTTKGISNIWDGDNGPKVKNILFGLSVAKFIK